MLCLEVSSEARGFEAVVAAGCEDEIVALGGKLAGDF